MACGDAANTNITAKMFCYGYKFLRTQNADRTKKKVSLVLTGDNKTRTSEAKVCTNPKNQLRERITKRKTKLSNTHTHKKKSLTICLQMFNDLTLGAVQQ